MNKKYAIAALVVISAGAAGWFGIHTVERQTEQAVADALSSVSAQASEIRYSLLENTLTLKGVTYELPGDDVSRRGSLESVEVKGFNRKYVFTRSDAPYSPDALPLVADAITAAGITDSTQMDGVKVEQRVEKVQLTGWHQRLGTLLALNEQHRGDASFFEELYRCRIDGMEIDNVSMTLSEVDTPAVSVAVEGISFPDGVRAPRDGEKVAPVRVRFDGFHVSGRDFSGGLRKLEFYDVLAPDPEILAAFCQLFGAVDDLEDEEKRYLAEERLISDIENLLLKNYENRVPVGRVLAEEGSFSLQDSPEETGAKPAVFSMALKSFDYRLSLTEEGAIKDATKLSGLKMNFPDTMDEADILSRYAPEGLVLNMTSSSLIGDDVFSGSARYEMEGLGELEGSLDLVGDIRALQRVVLEGDPSGEMNRLMQSVRLKGMNVVYRDSGFLPMSVEIAARWSDSTVENELKEISALLQKMAQEKERPVRECGAALYEQLEHPGEFVMTIAPERPMNFMEVITLASINPDALPVTFGSKPGEKALTDYLPKP